MQNQAVGLNALNNNTESFFYGFLVISRGRRAVRLTLLHFIAATSCFIFLSWLSWAPRVPPGSPKHLWNIKPGCETECIK